MSLGQVEPEIDGMLEQEVCEQPWCSGSDPQFNHLLDATKVIARDEARPMSLASAFGIALHCNVPGVAAVPARHASQKLLFLQDQGRQAQNRAVLHSRVGELLEVPLSDASMHVLEPALQKQKQLVAKEALLRKRVEQDPTLHAALKLVCAVTEWAVQIAGRRPKTCRLRTRS